MASLRRRHTTVLLPALLAWAAASIAALAPTAGARAALRVSFLDRFSTIGALARTVPPRGAAAGDQNPYGVAVVPRTVGRLVRGDVLVSNFNDAGNLQGTGSSIVELSPGGRARVFAVVPRPTATPAVGLTTALVVLRSGFVIVGSLPAPGGMSSAMTAGALTILNASGRVVRTLAGGGIDGPWDMTAVERGSRVTLFVSNVLNGTVAAHGAVVDRGTVVRLRLSFHGARVAVSSEQAIATGFGERTDPSALVVGPTGVGLGRGGTLYVADSVGDRIAAIPHAMTRTGVLAGGGVTVSSGGRLHDPLGLAIAPGGDVVTVNGGDGQAVETTPAGRQVAHRTLVAMGAGDLFGLAIAPGGAGLYFVDDAAPPAPAANSLELLHR